MTPAIQQSRDTECRAESPEARHTPTPWAVDPIEKEVVSFKGTEVARCAMRGFKSHGFSATETLANAAFIVEAVNSHAALQARVEEQDKLLAAAADILNITPNMDAMDVGYAITVYRLAKQKALATSLERQQTHD